MIIKYKPTFSNEESKEQSYNSASLKEPIFDIKFKYGLNEFLELYALNDDYIALIDEGNRNISVWSVNKD
jgi:hypothetical protein